MSTQAELDSLVKNVIDDGRMSGQQLLVVGLCLILNMLDGFDITAMAVVAGAVSTELSLSPERLGWVFSFALFGMMIGAMFLAPISDIVGRRKTIIASVLLVGVSILLTANASSLSEFILLRFISGLGAGAMLACQAALAAEYSPEKYRALSVAAVTAGYPLGAMLTSVAAGMIVPDFGWRGMFWFGGGMTLIMGVIAWTFMPESLKYLLMRRPKNALIGANRILGKLGQAPLTSLPNLDDSKQSGKTGFLTTLLKLFSRDNIKTTITLWTVFFLCFSTLYFLMSWIPKLMEDSGHSRDVGRQAFFLFNFGGVIGIFLMGMMSTRWKLTNLVFFMLIASSICMVAFAWAPNELGVLLAIIFGTGLLQQGGFTGLYSVAAKAYSTDVRSTGIGWAIGLGRSGAVAGPAIAGYLIAAGYDMSDNFIFFAIPMALGGAIAYRLHIK